jgi:hypothetical protein
MAQALANSRMPEDLQTRHDHLGLRRKPVIAGGELAKHYGGVADVSDIHRSVTAHAYAREIPESVDRSLFLPG